MLFVYNFIQILVGTLSAPVLIGIAFLKSKYRRRTLDRLGFGLAGLRAKISAGRPRIWIHALSVGEVASSRELVKQLRLKLPDAVILFSTTTRTGNDLARRDLAGHVDLFVPFPFDLFFVVNRFIQELDPDFFILVETDFWPNFLHRLQKKGKKALLVNGRFSAGSFQLYKRFRSLFLPAFEVFSVLSMQSREDAEKLVDFGVPEGKTVTLGNLKYETAIPAETGGTAGGRSDLHKYGIDGTDRLIWIAGSTHEGEEEIILSVYRNLLQKYPRLFLILAPRKVERGKEILQLAGGQGLSACRRSRPEQGGEDVLILDTLGELAGLYGVCDFAFIGGSLVPQRGHNPLEAAVHAKTVFFGPHMEDFSEISADLIREKGAVVVRNKEELENFLNKLVQDENLRNEMGANASQLVLSHKGVLAAHLDLICNIIEQRNLDEKAS